MSSEDVPLFDVANAPVAKPKPRPGPTGKPVWSRYHGTLAMKCDDCLAVLADNHGNGPATRQARYKRSLGRGNYRLLCYAHAQQQREDDGLAGLG